MATTYTPGVFQSFRATTTFHLGALGIDISADQTVEFDGKVILNQPPAL